MNIITAVEEGAPGVPVYSLVADDGDATYHELAGADETFRARTLLGRGIANEVRNTVRTEIDGPVTLGEESETVEIAVDRGSGILPGTIGWRYSAAMGLCLYY